MENFKFLAVKGAFWSGVQLAVNTSFTFVIRLLLAKILEPSEFGVIGMAAIFTGFVQVINDLGIAAALVQKKDSELNENHFQTAFWTGILWSFFLYSIISFILGPVAANFYNQPILSKLIPVLSLGILFSTVNMIHKAQLTKQMNFKQIAFIDNTGNFVAGITALTLAYFGAGVWSLAFNSVASIIIAMPLYFKATHWLPRFKWDKEAFIDIFRFGAFTSGTNILNYLINNLDYFLIGKLLSAQALGVYTFAFILTDTFKSRLMSVINNVMYPLYGKKQSDPDALKRYYLKVINYNSIIVYPIMILLFILGEPFILNVFDAKWINSVEPLRILSVAVMVHMLVNSNTSFIRGMGRPDLEMKLQLLKAAIFVPMILYGVYYHGLVGASYAILINKVIAVILAQYTYNRLLHVQITTLDLLNSMRTTLIASSFAFILTYTAFNLLKLHFIVCSIILFVTYFGVVWIQIGEELKVQYHQFKFSSKVR